jgi:uncharacterized protein YhhL (DUF1145 family)
VAAEHLAQQAPVWVVLVVGVMQPRRGSLELPIQVVVGVRVMVTHRLMLAALAVQVSSSSRPINNEESMETKIYRLYGIDTAMHLLRPGAKWEISNTYFSRWEDPRPCPTWQEVQDTMEKIKAFEDSINTIWLPEQVEELTGQMEVQKQVDAIIAEQKAA